jgi:hypothetical protein
MSWQPDGEWKRVEKPLTPAALYTALSYATEAAYQDQLARFISMIHPEDILTEVSEGNNNGVTNYYLGIGTRLSPNGTTRIPNGVSYRLVISAWMS